MEFAEKIGLYRDKVMSYTLQVRRFTTFFRRFVAHAPQRVLLDFGLMLGLGFVQGIGVLMLIPLLSYVGLTDGSSGGPVASIAAFFFESLGLPQSLPVILVLYTTLVATLAFLSRRQSVLNMELQLGFIRRLRHDVYAAIVRADWRFVVASRQAALTQVLTHDVQRAGQAVFYLMRGAATTVMLAVYFAISLRLSLPLTLLTCGTAGVLVFLLLSAGWGLAFTGFPYAIALRTGNPGAVNSSFILFFPFAFLTTTFLPQEALTGWLATVADYNTVHTFDVKCELDKKATSGGFKWTATPPNPNRLFTVNPRPTRCSGSSSSPV